MAVANSTLTWRVAGIAAAGAVAVITIGLWHVRPWQTPTDRTITRLEALSPELKRKICAHRCNNIPKYRSAAKHFDCIEVDVVLVPPIGGPAAVYHPPVENHHGLTLDFLLGNEGLPRGKLWLDVKDLSEENWEPFLDQLSRLVPSERRSDIIVETDWSGPAAVQAAAAFLEGGFNYSYYLPTDAAIDCGARRSDTCDALRTEVLHTVSLGFSHLSFDARAFPFVLSIRDQLPPEIRLLTWDMSRLWPLKPLIREVDIYIVSFPSRHST